MRKSPYLLLIIAFLANIFNPFPASFAQELYLPLPGSMVQLSTPFNPPILKGIKIDPDNPFRFEFILDKGDLFPQKQLNQEASRLIRYFLASLTIPEKDLWVNLSPYEKNRIIPQSFGLTEMGRDLLAEDYMLKQVTASLIYPEGKTGKKFWESIYESAEKQYGTTNIPVNTFNKVWIVPEKAVVYENTKAGTAYVIETKLKVMLEKDYLSMSKHMDARASRGQNPDTSRIGSDIVRQIVIPQLDKEVNEGRNFAQLRQVYNSLILATWYKKKIKDSLLEMVYADKKKVTGVGYGSSSPGAIYKRYLQAFKKGVFNYIKEENDPLTREAIPRKYFSGGVDATNLGDMAMSVIDDPSRMPQAIRDNAMANNNVIIGVRIDRARGDDPLRQRAALLEKQLGDDGSGNLVEDVDLSYNETDLNFYLKRQIAEALINHKILKINLSQIKASYWSLKLILARVSHLIAENVDLNKAPNVVGFDILELLKNAFVHGNHLNWELPIYIKIDASDQSVEVYDLNLTSMGHRVDPAAFMASKGILHGPHQGLGQIRSTSGVKFKLEDVISNEKIIGKKAEIDFAMQAVSLRGFFGNILRSKGYQDVVDQVIDGLQKNIKVLINKDDLDTIVKEIIDNAVDHRTDGMIKIGVSRKDNWVGISVTNNGEINYAGLRREALKYDLRSFNGHIIVFNKSNLIEYPALANAPKVQAPYGEDLLWIYGLSYKFKGRANRGGAGEGLANIQEDLDGKIEVKSAENKTTFTIFLPVADSAMAGNIELKNVNLRVKDVHLTREQMQEIVNAYLAAKGEKPLFAGQSDAQYLGQGSYNYVIGYGFSAFRLNKDIGGSLSHDRYYFALLKHLGIGPGVLSFNTIAINGNPHNILEVERFKEESREKKHEVLSGQEIIQIENMLDILIENRIFIEDFKLENIALENGKAFILDVDTAKEYYKPFEPRGKELAEMYIHIINSAKNRNWAQWTSYDPQGKIIKHLQDMAMNAFQPFDAIKEALRKDEDIFRKGWWVAFDMDKARDMEISLIAPAIGFLNKIILEKFNDEGAQFFTSGRTSDYYQIEEGFIYIPGDISQEELSGKLKAIREAFQYETHTTLRSTQTVTFAAIKGGGLSEGKGASNLESLMTGLLRSGKGVKGNFRSADYGNKTVFYGPNGGIDLSTGKDDLEIQNAGESIKFHLDAAMLEDLRDAPGFVPVIISVKPLANLQEFLCELSTK